MIPEGKLIEENQSHHISPTSYATEDALKISEIYRNELNISIWQRKLNDLLIKSSENVLNNNPNLEYSEVLKPVEVKQSLESVLGDNIEVSPFIEDVSYLSFMFCKLFDQKKLWLRLDGIDHPMCPRFHTDKIKCRLVTTYVGPATQWLPHNLVDRKKLGFGNDGKPDDQSGLFQSKQDIKQLDRGHVALLKGESWEGNEGAGVVHRSPHSEGNYKRLYLTIDFVESFINIYGRSLRF